jgi:hypothetical protein
MTPKNQFEAVVAGQRQVFGIDDDVVAVRRERLEGIRLAGYSRKYSFLQRLRLICGRPGCRWFPEKFFCWFQHGRHHRQVEKSPEVLQGDDFRDGRLASSGSRLGKLRQRSSDFITIS